MAAGQFAYLTPWIGAGLVGAAVAKWRSGFSGADRLCLALALPAIVVFTLVPLWGARGLPHWPMPGWLFLYPMLGGWLSGPWPGALRLRTWGAATAGVTLVLGVVLVAQADLGFAARWLGPRAAASDVTLETLGWGAVRQALPPGDPPAFAASVKWLDAGKIGVALGPSVPVLAYTDDPRGFAFLPGRDALIGKDGVLIVRASQESAARQDLGGFFAALGEGRPVSVDRAGIAEIPLVVIPAKGLKALPAP